MVSLVPATFPVFFFGFIAVLSFGLPHVLAGGTQRKRSMNVYATLEMETLRSVSCA